MPAGKLPISSSKPCNDLKARTQWIAAGLSSSLASSSCCRSTSTWMLSSTSLPLMLWQRPISPTVEHGTLWSMHLSLDNQSLDRCEAHHGCRPKQGMMQELCSLICRTFSQSASEVPFTAIHFTPAFVAALIKLGAVSTILLSCKWQCTSKSGVLVIAIAMAFQAYSATLPPFLPFLLPSFFYFCEKFRLLSVTLSSSGLMARPLSLSFVATPLSFESRNLSFLWVALESFLPEKQAILSRIFAIFLLV